MKNGTYARKTTVINEEVVITKIQKYVCRYLCRILCRLTNTRFVCKKLAGEGWCFMVENGPDYLKTYDEIQARKVRWIWYPYIALGKITLLQGDPGDGKSTMMLSLIAKLSKAGRLPYNVKISSPIKSLYQCSKDDAYETIKPRLEFFDANCGNVEFIDEEMVENLTLDDEKIREAIVLLHSLLLSD